MAKLYPFSENTRQLLAEGPCPGETHLWLSRVAGGLKGVLSKEACFTFLREVCDEGVSHREVPDREVAGAVELAYKERVEGVNAGRGSLNWPERDDGLVNEILAKTEALFSVENKSNVERRNVSEVGDQKSEVGSRHVEVVQQGTAAPTISAADVLPGLFLPGELVCAGPSSDKPRIRPVEDWLGDADKMQLICVNPMRAKYGRNKEGGLSIRCQDNVRLRRYLVAEFDDKERSKTEQACLISALARMVPLVLVVDSGGKSLHAWFRVEGLGVKDQARFFAACCAVGADPTRWDICGWLRMPGGTRRSRVGDGRSEIEDPSSPKGYAGTCSGVRQRILFAADQRSDCPSTRVARSGCASRRGDV